MREDQTDDNGFPSPGSRRARSRDSDRRSAKSMRDPRDEFDEPMRPSARRGRDGRDREGTHDRDERKIDRRPTSPLEDDRDSRRRIPSPPMK